MQSKVSAIGVVLECAVAMVGLTSPTAVTEIRAFQAWAMCAQPPQAATWHRFILQTIAIEEQTLQAAAALIAAIPGSAPALQSIL
jgi:hypothetical protein